VLRLPPDAAASGDPEECRHDHRFRFDRLRLLDDLSWAVQDHILPIDSIASACHSCGSARAPAQDCRQHRHWRSWASTHRSWAPEDFEEFRRWLESKGVDTASIRTIPGQWTASFFVTTDTINSQIASFYTGPCHCAGELRWGELSHYRPW
jgi:hypothetical protein